MVAKTIQLPNIKKLFIPDPGYTIFDIDLDRADAQVVAWEGNDPTLKAAFKEGLDVHLLNASSIFQLGITVDDVRDSALADKLAKEFHQQRQKAKQGVHGTNYGASAYTIARTLNISQGAAEAFQEQWFIEHPGIADWHDRVENALQTKRRVENKFGFRRTYFDRIDDLLPEALAWIPQSTVALVINKGYVNLHKNVPDVQILLQVHDSLVGQCPTPIFKELLPEIKKNTLIEIPYDDPLTIGVGIKASTKSWGECKEINWETGE